MNVNINGKTKNEIIYNKLIDSMNEMKMSKDEQIEYLKLKVSNLEVETRNKFLLLTLLTIGTIALLVGLYLMYVRLYILGLIFVFGTFIALSIKLIMTAKRSAVIRNSKYDEIERIKSLLNIKLK